jgi:hypothetical protein
VTLQNASVKVAMKRSPSTLDTGKRHWCDPIGCVPGSDGLEVVSATVTASASDNAAIPRAPIYLADKLQPAQSTGEVVLSRDVLTG